MVEIATTTSKAALTLDLKNRAKAFLKAWNSRRACFESLFEKRSMQSISLCSIEKTAVKASKTLTPTDPISNLVKTIAKLAYNRDGGREAIRLNLHPKGTSQGASRARQTSILSRISPFCAHPILPNRPQSLFYLALSVSYESAGDLPLRRCCSRDPHARLAPPPRVFGHIALNPGRALSLPCRG